MYIVPNILYLEDKFWPQSSDQANEKKNRKQTPFHFIILYCLVSLEGEMDTGWESEWIMLLKQTLHDVYTLLHHWAMKSQQNPDITLTMYLTQSPPDSHHPHIV